MDTPEKNTTPPDEFERLEELQRRSKAVQEAWRNLLENLRKLNTEPDENTEHEKPNT